MRIIYIFSLVLLLASCSTIKNTTITNITTKEQNADIEICSEFEEFHNIGTTESSYKIDNRITSHMVKISKEGYKTVCYPIFVSDFNYLKLLDFSLPIISDIVFAKSFSAAVDGDDDKVTLLFISMVPGTFGWGLGLVGPWKTYPEQYDFPELEPLPKRTEDLSYLVGDGFTLADGLNNYTVNYYKSFKTYNQASSFYDTPIHISSLLKSLDFNSSFNEVLEEYDFIDSTIFDKTNRLNTRLINCSLDAVTEHRVQNLSKFEYHVTFNIQNYYPAKRIDSVQVVSYSDWIYGNSIDRGDFSIIDDAISNSFFELFKNANISTLLFNSEPVFKKTLEDWDTIRITNPAKRPDNINGVVKSTVSIETDNGVGTGIILSEDGNILTNDHVIADAEKIMVRVNADQLLPGRVIRSNPLADLALVKIDTSGLFPVSLAPDTEEILGEDVYAIGISAHFGINKTVSKGIISSYQTINGTRYIQTDVSINPGSSGGPLLNSSGQLIGIVSSKIVGIGIEGIGYAIISSEIKDALKVKLVLPGRE